MDDLAAHNLRPREFELQNWEDYPLLMRFVSEGIVCKWGLESSDVIVVVGQLPMDEPAWNTLRADLEAEGYVANDKYGIPGFIDGPGTYDDAGYLTSGFVWCAGILYYASYPAILNFVPVFS